MGGISMSYEVGGKQIRTWDVIPGNTLQPDPATLTEVTLAADVHENGTITWVATASLNGSPQYDTGAARCTTPMDAMAVLAQVLYQELTELQAAHDFEHPSTGTKGTLE
jgi:hypothetical protein